MNKIEIENLTKEYKMYPRKIDRLQELIFPWIKKHSTFTAVNNLNLTVSEGEILGILGRNGAGKSTLLKMITGVVTPTNGIMKIDGKISSLLELGAAFNGELTGEENIYQHGQVMGLTKEEIENIKQDIIDFADIGEHLSQPVKTYSSGMFARLAFACAIHVKPDILIVDEVLSVGDIAFQIKCFKKFEEFKKEGKTILFVSHSLEDILKNCTRCIVMEQGQKTFDGETKEAVDFYKKRIAENVEKKLGNNSINYIQKKETNKFNIPKGKNYWFKQMEYNKNVEVYGNEKASIIDYAVFDKKDNIVSSINNDDEYTIKMKVKFNSSIENPIFSFSIKDVRGMDLCGMNTDIQKIKTGHYKKGDIVTISFRQVIPLAPRKYVISFGCSKYTKDGDLEIFSRKYDALFIDIANKRFTSGLFDLKTNIEIEKGKNEG